VTARIPLRLQVHIGVPKKIARIFSDSGFPVAGARHVRYGKNPFEVVGFQNHRNLDSKSEKLLLVETLSLSDAGLITEIVLR